MVVEIIVDGLKRTYQGYYEELHSRDWNERLQDLIDTAHEYEEPVELPEEVEEEEETI